MRVLREKLRQDVFRRTSPGFDTILRVIGVLGLKLHVQAGSR